MKHCVVSKSGKHKYGVTISLNKCLYCSLQAETESMQNSLNLCKACGKMTHHTSENCPTTPKEGWEEKKIKEFREKYTYLDRDGRNWSSMPSNVEVFLIQAIKDARAEERRFIGKNKREWYQKGIRDGKSELLYKISKDIDILVTLTNNDVHNNAVLRLKNYILKMDVQNNKDFWTGDFNKQFCRKSKGLETKGTYPDDWFLKENIKSGDMKDFIRNLRRI